MTLPGHDDPATQSGAVLRAPLHSIALRWASKCASVQAGGSGGAGGAAARQLQRVTDAIEAGGWWEQFGAVALLRLTPVVPFRRGETRQLAVMCSVRYHSSRLMQ